MEPATKCTTEDSSFIRSILSCTSTTHFDQLLRQAVLLVLTAVILIESLLIFQNDHQLLPPLIRIIVTRLCPILIFFLLTNSSRPQQTYLVDFSCFKPPNFCRVPHSAFLEHASLSGFFDQQAISLMAKALSVSGQGQETYLPPSLHYIPPGSFHHSSIDEVHMVLFPVMEDLLTKTNLSPFDVDILIVNCSGFCPSPSLSSIIINRFSMREDVKSYNLSGMGCSAAMAAIDLARNLLQVHKESNAVILSTEILSTGWYPGNDPSMLALNCIFRMGSSAVLLTNKKGATSKYKLVQTLRTQTAFDDSSYSHAMREEDSVGLTGVTIRKGSIQKVHELVRIHVTVLGSRMLPLKEKVRYGVSLTWNKFVDEASEVYVPNFRSVIQHFVLPTTAKPYVRELGRILKLDEGEIEGALMTLHRFGNQSSSSLWYELAYMEAKERIKVGDKVWQLGKGSGMKCNSAVWECVRPITGEAKKGPWADCIHNYPVLN